MSTPPTPKRSFRRKLLHVAVRWALVYCGIVAVFLFLERSLVFRPDAVWFPPADPRTVDVTFVAADGPVIHGRWLPPDKPGEGAFLIACGNGGNMYHRESMATDFRRATGAG